MDNKKEVKLYKTTSVIYATEPDAVFFVKGVNETTVRTYITTTDGQAIPLKDLSGGGSGSGIQFLASGDSSIAITGTATSKNIQVSSALQTLINSALQASDPISSLTNDSGYITLADVPTFNPSDYDLEDFNNAGADPFVKQSELPSGGATNLGYVASPTDGEVTSDTGTSATIPLADSTNAGLLSPAEKSKIATAIQPSDLGAVATSNDYNDLDNLPTIPNGVTNLGYTTSPTSGIVTSDTGLDATIPTVDYTNAGLQTPSDKQLEYNNASTGLTYFQGLSINTDTTKFNVGALKGWFVDNTTNPETPTKIYVNFPQSLANSVTNLATQNVTYIAIDSTGTLHQSSIPFEPEVQRDWIPLGVIVHSNRTTINAVNNQPVVALSPNNQLSDLIESIGFFNIYGNVFSPNGANLNINKSAGHVFKQGSNFVNDSKDPHTLSLSALIAPSNIRYRLQDGTESVDTNEVSPNFWDDGGTLTAMTGTRWSIQRIYLFQSNLVRIQYGQATYATRADAIEAISTEAFVTEQNILENGLFRGLLIVRRNTTDLTDSTRALFVEASKFGSVAGLGSLSTTNLQQAYNNSTEPEIITDSTLGAVTVKRGSALDTDSVFEIKNGADTVTAFINGNGEITSNSETASTIASFDTDKKIKSLDTSTYPSLTEISYIKGLTSSIQSQLDLKDLLPVVYEKHASVPVFGSASLNTLEGVAFSVTGASSRSFSDTNTYTRRQKLGLVVSAVGNLAQARQTSTYFNRNSNLDIILGVGFAENCDDSLVRVFAGVSSQTIFSNIEPTSLLNCIGLAKLTTSNNLHLIHNDGSGAATEIDLGVNFPSNTVSTDFYILRLKTNGSDVDYTVNRVNTNDTVTGTITTDIPATTQALNLGYYVVQSSGSSTTTGIDFFGTNIIKQ